MDVLHPMNPEAAMATADDVMELSAEGRTPMGDDIDIDFGDSDQANAAGEDQDMIEDDADGLLDDEMADEDADSAPQLDTDVDFDEPRDEVLESAEEVKMRSRDTTDVASPMAQGITPAPETSFAPMPEVTEPQETEAHTRGAKLPEDAQTETHNQPATAIEEEGVAARDFAATDEGAVEVPQIVEHPPSAEASEVAADPEPTNDQHHQGKTEPEASNNLQDHNPSDDAEAAQTSEAVGSAEENHDHEEGHEAEEDLTGTAGDDNDNEETRSEADSFAEQGPIHAIVVDYHGSKMSLFPPSTDHEGSESFLLEDEALCHEPISSLLADCRRVLKDDVLDNEEVILHVPCLGISIAEGAAGPMSATMSDLVDLFLSLSYNDGIDDPSAMAITLEVKQKVHTRLDFIRSLIAEGKGLSHIYKEAETPRGPQEHEEAPQFVDSSRDELADGADLTRGPFDDADDQASEREFEEQFEVHTPGREGLLEGHEEEDYLDFASPYKATKDIQPEEHTELGDSFGEVKQAFGHDLSHEQDTFTSEEFVNDPGQEFDEVNLRGDADIGLDLNQEFDESYEAGADDANTNQSSKPPQDNAADAQHSGEPADAGHAAEDAHEAEAEAEDGEDGEDDEETVESTIEYPPDDEEGDEEDEPADPSSNGAVHEIPANDDESHTEVGDDPSKGPASPSSLKRRRSYEEAADLLDDTLTPSPQAKRTRPS